MNIVCFSNIDWNFIFQRHQHLMLSLLQKEQVNNIFFVETLGTRSLKLNKEDCRRAINKVFLKLRSPYSKSEKNVASYPNLHILSPKFIPIFNEPFFTINEIILKHQLKSLLNKKNIKLEDTIAWVILQHPTVLKLIKDLKFKKVLFDCIDDVKSFPNVKNIIVETEKKMISFSDIVTVTSQKLYTHCNRYNENVYMLKNGVEDNLIKPIDVNENKNKKILGYIGTVYEWFDLSAIKYLLDNRKDIEIRIIGPVRLNIDELKNYKNIKFYGKISYEKIEKEIEAFDVCLIPFKINQLTLSTNPVKLYEYFSKGKPVVSSALPELIQYKDYVYIYKNKEEFLKYINLALKENETLKNIGRQEIAKENTWQKRADFILDIFKQEEFI